jgi:glutamyl/glutaminyl-tRNA synthetase
MQRMERYRSVLAEMLANGTAYYCYSSPEEVEAMRERQRAAGDKPRYDGTWRPEVGKTLPAIPADRKPVIRFKNPLDGEVSWNDVVKERSRSAIKSWTIWSLRVRMARQLTIFASRWMTGICRLPTSFVVMIT